MQPLLAHHAIALVIHIAAMRVACRLPIEEHTKAHGCSWRCWPLLTVAFAYPLPHSVEDYQVSPGCVREPRGHPWRHPGRDRMPDGHE
jgi:hypothetical protein